MFSNGDTWQVHVAEDWFLMIGCTNDLFSFELIVMLVRFVGSAANVQASGALPFVVFFHPDIVWNEREREMRKQNIYRRGCLERDFID